MLIVEGPDGAGKTTLIRTIMHEIPGQFEIQDRAVTSEDGPVMDLAEWTERHLGMWPNTYPAHSKTPLYDRFTLISEPIYGPLTRGYLAPGFDNLEWFSRAWAYMLQYDPFYIFCLPPLSQVRANIGAAQQMEGVNEQITAIYWQYHTQAARMRADGHSVYIYDYTASASLGWILDRLTK